ncbi:MAG: hypothetical protein QXH07_07700, partial [Thermoplasmata archaeon]
IYEVEGNKDIIVVIPTADFNGRYAKTCRDEIFKGLHIIFVVSGKGNYYFNFAHNCNVGIKKALEYSPKWIILSNDDMHKIDDISALVEQLKIVNNEEYGAVFFNPPRFYYSRIDYVAKNRFPTFKKLIGYLYNLLFKKENAKLYKINCLNNIKFQPIEGYPKINNKKENIFNHIFYKIFYKKILEFKEFMSIGIFSTKMINKFLVRNGYFFDEIFINAFEDVDLAISIKLSNFKTTEINFRINPIIGGTFDNGIGRCLRGVVDGIYLSYKLEKVFEK